MSELKFDFKNMLAHTIGAEHGVTREEIRESSSLIKRAREDLNKWREGRGVTFFDLPDQEEMVMGIKEMCGRKTNKFEDLVLLGIGGSSLGAVALHQGLNHPFHNLLVKGKGLRCLNPKSEPQITQITQIKSEIRHLNSELRTPNSELRNPNSELRNQERGGCRFFVTDNIDPVYIASIMDMIDPKTTLFNVVSKSGTTVETMAQFMIVYDILKSSVGEEYKDHLIITTDPKKGPLRELINLEGIDSFDVPEGVGGRYSVLSPVGLLPAALCGIDVEQIMEGARIMRGRLLVDDVEENPCLMMASLLYLAYKEKKKYINVILPYMNALWGVGMWFRQLWAESLGKRFSLDGREVYEGITSVVALGATDQHSQLQLWVEGPNQNVLIFLDVDDYQVVTNIPGSSIGFNDFKFLEEKSVNQLIRAEKSATEQVLTTSGRPNMTITLPVLDPYTIGQLLFFFEYLTAIMGYMLRINPFDQPGVEEGKKITRKIMEGGD